MSNDIAIFPVNEYIPNIWENLWYNDSSIAGYSKGDVVWKGVMLFKDFLSSYASSIQQYANNNPKLNSYFKFSPSDYMHEV